jgi:hypothetical protein
LIDPVFYYRYAKNEPVRWTQRRRSKMDLFKLFIGIVDNPYYSSPALWKVKYNEKLEPLAI